MTLGGSGGTLTGLAQIGSQVGASAAFMKFSRDDERQAAESSQPL
jgi:hypothetical protein